MPEPHLSGMRDAFETLRAHIVELRAELQRLSVARMAIETFNWTGDFAADVRACSVHDCRSVVARNRMAAARVTWAARREAMSETPFCLYL